MSKREEKKEEKLKQKSKDKKKHSKDKKSKKDKEKKSTTKDKAPRSGILGNLAKLDPKQIDSIPTTSNRRSSSSRFLGVDSRLVLERLPEVRSLPESDRDTMFITKLRQCQVVFDFCGLASLEQMEIKRDTLIELIDFVLTEDHVFSEGVYKEMVDMIQVNLFRPLPPRLNPEGLEYDPEEDEPILEEAWPHVQLVYELFLSFLEDREFDSEIGIKYITTKFVTKLLILFDSEDPRERDYLKATLHRIYGKFLTLRIFVKNEIENIFHVFCSGENGYHNGIAELLEILGSIINGYGVPLREEHVDFLFDTIMPLHKTRFISLYHPQLAYCVIKYLDKDPYLTTRVVEELIKCYPKTDSSKELLFLDEIEDILSIIDIEEFESIQDIVFKLISDCISSGRFQSAERALALWNNEIILTYILDNAREILKIVFPALHYASKNHWHRAIRSLSTTVLKLFLEINEEDFVEVVQNFKAQQEMEYKKTNEIYQLWEQLLANVDGSIGLAPKELLVPENQKMVNLYLEELAESTEDDDIIEVAEVKKEVLPMSNITLQALLTHNNYSTSSSEEDYTYSYSTDSEISSDTYHRPSSSLSSSDDFSSTISCD